MPTQSCDQQLEHVLANFAVPKVHAHRSGDSTPPWGQPLAVSVVTPTKAYSNLRVSIALSHLSVDIMFCWHYKVHSQTAFQCVPAPTLCTWFQSCVLYLQNWRMQSRLTGLPSLVGNHGFRSAPIPLAKLSRSKVYRNRQFSLSFFCHLLFRMVFFEDSLGRFNSGVRESLIEFSMRVKFDRFIPLNYSAQPWRLSRVSYIHAVSSCSLFLFLLQTRFRGHLFDFLSFCTLVSFYRVCLGW